MVEAASERGWSLKSPPEAAHRGGSVMLGVEDPEQIEAGLPRRGVFVDWRPGVVRLSPHFFNTDEEIEEALEVLEELLG